MKDLTPYSWKTSPSSSPAWSRHQHRDLRSRTHGDGRGIGMSPIHVLTVILWSALLPAQNVITSAGYFSPAPVSVAPGQVITLFVDGVGKSLTQPVRAPSGLGPL